MTVSKTSSEEVGHRIPVKNSKCKGYARQGVIKPEHESRIVPVSRITGGKDRHSKVRTSRGLRDRRVRLSVNTAIQFYDLQDRLGFQQPSMAVDWLINAARDAIKDLPELPSEICSGSQITTITTLSGESADKQANNSSTRSEPQDEQSKIQGHDSPDKAKGTWSNSSASEGSIKASGPARSTLTSKAKAFRRDKARQKAREREFAKKKTSSTDSPLPQPQQTFNEILPLPHPFNVPFKNILPCSCLRPNNAHEDGAGVAAVNHSLQLWKHMLPAYQALICNQDASKVAQSITSSMGAGTTAASSYEGYGIMDFAVETQNANQSELGCDNDSERVHPHIQSPGLFKVSAPRLGTRGPLQSNSDSISMPASSSDFTHKGPCQDFNTEGGSLGVFFHRNRACHQSNRML